MTGESKYKPWQMTAEIVAQIWAEVKILADAGEKLYLPPELEEYAKIEQREAMEQDDREGIVAEYLSMLLPDGWDKMDLFARKVYIRDPNDPTQPQGQYERKEVTNIVIWCECFGKPKEDMKPHDSYAISAIMTRLSGWKKNPTPKYIPIYGSQRYYNKL